MFTCLYKKITIRHWFLLRTRPVTGKLVTLIVSVQYWTFLWSGSMRTTGRVGITPDNTKLLTYGPSCQGKFFLNLPRVCQKGSIDHFGICNFSRNRIRY